ncbi:MAG: lipoprotein [Bauldia sp.]|nr:lipoprotein [Bauldia sp.]
MIATRRSPLAAALALIIVTLALAGCGRKGPLEAPPGAAAITATTSPATMPATTAP